MRLLRKTDILLIAILAVIPACMLAFNVVSAVNHTDVRLVILRDGEIFGTYPLTEDRIIEIGETNICEISGGEVKMTHADCPDQVCVHSPRINRYGGTIVCLPNKVILSIEGEESDKDPDAPDAVARLITEILLLNECNEASSLPGRNSHQNRISRSLYGPGHTDGIC